MKEGQFLVFPCKVTNPHTKVSLVKVRNLFWSVCHYKLIFLCKTLVVRQMCVIIKKAVNVFLKIVHISHYYGGPVLNMWYRSLLD